jgi:hypothetical protein
MTVRRLMIAHLSRSPLQHSRVTAVLVSIIMEEGFVLVEVEGS